MPVKYRHSKGGGRSPLSDDGELRATLLMRLAKAFGQDVVLTDPEDLYVYSHYSRFGARSIPRSLAVVKLGSEAEEARLREIIVPLGVSVFRTSDSKSGKLPVGPIVIADTGNRVTSESLSGRHSALFEARVVKRRELKDAKSLPERFLASLREGHGYRIEEVKDSGEGFCVLEPLLDGRETTSAKGRLVMSRGLMRGDLKASKKLSDSIYGCTACGQCYDHVTLEGFEVNNAIVRARSEIVAQGMEPGKCKLLRKNINDSGNPLGLPAEDRALWFEELVEDHPYRKGDLLYWTGCSTAYRLPEVVLATANILRKARVSFGVLGEGEGCCGLILYLLGMWDEATMNASTVVEKLAGLGVRELVTSCAGCFYAFTRVYRRLGVEVPFRVQHTSQVMESLIDDGRLELRSTRKSYVWHDPCDLGRHCEVYEPPRKVLRAIPGISLVEPPLSGSHALCCGGGGGMWSTNKELAEMAAAMKLEGISSLGADGIVTGCPNCILILRYAAETGEAQNILDLAELVDHCSEKAI